MTQSSQKTPDTGKVFLVGAGPGDPGLLTLRGAEVLAAADCVVYDRLANPRLLQLARQDAELIYVGKQASRHAMPQAEINALLVDRAKQGLSVCRLKGGDPFVFGRGGEEAEALADAGVPFEVVPGVTSAVAVPAYAGIPVTHRGYCSALGIITGHEDPTKGGSSLRWKALARGLDTMVFLMAVENLPRIVSELTEAEMPLDTPVALIQWGTWSRQQTVTGVLSDIVRRVQEAGLTSPAVTVVGHVVSLRDKLRWFDTRPLFGWRVLVTRTREQASSLVRLLEEQGAEAVELPTIRLEPIHSPALPVDALTRFDWIVFTSANGVRYFTEWILRDVGDIRAIGSAKLAAIGPATAEAISNRGLRVEFQPDREVAEALAEGLPGSLDGRRVLIPRAEDARDVLPEILSARGAEVTVLPVYRTVPAEPGTAPEVADMLRQGDLDALTFTSSSTVGNFVRLFGTDWLAVSPHPPVVACIGPITAETAKNHGLPVDVVPDESFTVPSLVRALVQYAKCGKS
ncbi:MAG: uroporphyrinogen-III C-methyltransferase [Armatimonadota bacterium]